jgi:hypothetical protein
MFYPRPITGMPYLEGIANLALTATGKNENQSTNMEMKVNNFKWFDSLATKEPQQLNFVVSRQGKVGDLNAKGKMANWLTPDVSSMVALLPVEGIRPGDRWESKESLRIPILQGTDLAAVKPIIMEIAYVRDTVMNGKRCRYLRSSAEIWANELDIQLADIFPKEEINRVGGSNFQFYHPKRGKVLYKREQWVDMATGIVEKAKTQIRLICWVRDLRKTVPASNADKDFNMFLSLAQATTITLK